MLSFLLVILQFYTTHSMNTTQDSSSTESRIVFGMEVLDVDLNLIQRDMESMDSSIKSKIKSIDRSDTDKWLALCKQVVDSEVKAHSLSWSLVPEDRKEETKSCRVRWCLFYLINIDRLDCLSKIKDKKRLMN